MGASNNTVDEDEDIRPFIGGITLTTIQRHSVAVRGGGVVSIGEMVDDYLAKAARDGKDVQKVEFFMEPEQWAMVAPNYMRAARK